MHLTIVASPPSDTAVSHNMVKLNARRIQRSYCFVYQFLRSFRPHCANEANQSLGMVQVFLHLYQPSLRAAVYNDRGTGFQKTIANATPSDANTTNNPSCLT
jgi:hypothetical protein